MNESVSGSIRVPRHPNDDKPKVPLGAVAGIVLLTAAVSAGSGAGIATLLQDDNTAASQPVATSSATNAAANGSAVTSVADLYAQLRPSVVKINVVTAAGGGTGSGVILDTEGHIVTNYHVVVDANELDVKLSDGTEVTATVLGTDPGDDLALIQIDASNLDLKPVTLADTSKLRIGDGVIAIGNPLDLEATLTEGVVSGLGRVLSDGAGRPLRELIQTDSAINPGNSGGGLFDLNGHLVGITNAIENPSGEAAFSGIGYAIPASTVQQYLQDMLAGKTVTHPRLGVALGDLSPAIANDLNVSVDTGVIIGSVDPGSGAAKAGLRGTTASQPGDVIVSINGQDVSSFDDLASYLDTQKPGDTVTLGVVRGSETIAVPVTLDAWTQN